MPSIRWGIDTGADVCVPFLGNVSLNGCRLIGAGGADDDIALQYATRDLGDKAVFHVPMTEGSGNALDTVGSHDASVRTWTTPGDNDAPALTDGSGRAALSIIRGAVVRLRASWPDGHTKTVTLTVPDQDAYDVGADL